MHLVNKDSYSFVFDKLQDTLDKMGRREIEDTVVELGIFLALYLKQAGLEYDTLGLINPSSIKILNLVVELKEEYEVLKKLKANNS